MANYIVTDTDLTGIADAIRTKSGGSGQLEFPNGFVSEINNISVGGDTTPYYMWRDEDGYINFLASKHGGYQINVSSVEPIWSTIYEGTISEWQQMDHCYDHEANVNLDFGDGETYRVTYDGTPYICVYNDGVLGSDVYSWDGVSQLDYPFGIYLGGDITYFGVTTGGTHTFLIEHAG